MTTSIPLTIPMSGTFPAVLPRLQGDGMDSDRLPSRTPSSSHPRHKNLQGDGMDSDRLPSRTPSSSHPRHKNLQPESTATTTRQNKRHNVPREPVKAAIKPVLPQAKHNAYQAQETTAATQNLYRNKVNVTNSRNVTVETKSQLIPSAYGHTKSTNHAHHPPVPAATWNYASSGSAQAYNNIGCSGVPAVTQGKAGESIVEVAVEMGEQEAGEEAEERSVEGSVDSHLTLQVKDLKDQLDMQIKVNSDLKKLLVASVGDDLHHKVEAIVRTRAQLATDITEIDKQRKEEYEDLDNLTIQADMWRSKYMASRVLVDKLQRDKAVTEQQRSTSLKALQQMMAERRQLHEDLKHTHRYLKLVRDAFDRRALGEAVTIIPNLLELAHTNLRLAEAAKASLLPTTPLLTAALDQGVHNGLSPAERLAMQILSSCSPPNPTTSTDPPGLTTQQAANNFYRFHPSVRYDNITFDCCRKCKGEIHIV